MSAEAKQDSTVKVWDVASGQETLTLKGHTGKVTSVAFSLDGARIVSGSDDGTVRFWDARLSTPEELAAANLVGYLFEKLLLKSEVIARIKSDNTLTEQLRGIALKIAATTTEISESLNEAAWKTVASPHRSVDDYDLALRYAEAASRAMPENGMFLNTLGVAQYRVGKHQDALQTLTRSNALNVSRFAGAHPADLAFIAMVHHQLGHSEQAHSFLDQLHNLMKSPPWIDNDESQGFLRGAEELLGFASETEAATTSDATN